MPVPGRSANSFFRLLASNKYSDATVIVESNGAAFMFGTAWRYAIALRPEGRSDCEASPAMRADSLGKGIVRQASWGHECTNVLRQFRMRQPGTLVMDH